MSTDVNAVEQQAEETVQVQAPEKNPFSEESWADKPVQQTQQQQEQVQQTGQEPQQQAAAKNEDEEVLDAEEFVKRTFEVGSLDEVKEALKGYKELKGQSAQELKFANDDSKKFFEYLKDGKEDDIYDFLSKKKQIEKLAAAEVNEQTAADIVKFAMKQKYNTLNDEQIDYKFKKQFALPKEPVQKDDELDDEFNARKEEWDEKVREIKMDLLIEANMAKPEIEKLKSQIVLPDIQKPTQQVEQTQISDEDIAKMREGYLAELESEAKNFNGFTISYKNEDVELPISYSIDEEERAAFKDKLSDFDPLGAVTQRWINQDGSRNLKQLMDDIYTLENKKKIYQKLVTEAGNKAVENYIKSKKNVSLQSSTQTHQPSVDNKSERDKLAELMFSS